MKLKSSKEITFECFHGGSQAAPEWFTTDRDHARYFGPVAKYRITARVLFVTRDDESNDDSGTGFQGMEDRAHELADITGCVAIRGWEGAGHCILVQRNFVEIEWLEGEPVPAAEEEEEEGEDENLDLSWDWTEAEGRE